MIKSLIQKYGENRLIAHRGGANVAPENTLPAFREAARRGFRWVECDVACTADGIPVLFHDDTLERTTNGHGHLHLIQYHDLVRLDAGCWFHPRFTTTRVPTLAEALEEWHRLDLIALVELKVGAGQDPEQLGSQVARTLVGSHHRLISFSIEALNAAKKIAPDIPRLLVVGDAPWTDAWMHQASRLGAMGLDVEHILITPELIDKIHNSDLEILCWTVNDPHRADQLLAWGVDGVTTDGIDLLGN